MGACLSKKSTNVSSPGALPKQIAEPTKPIAQIHVEKKKVEEETVKKEVFIIKHRKSHEVERRSEEEKAETKKGAVEPAETANNAPNNSVFAGALGSNGSDLLVASQVRTSSCTKEEVDAILIQCGRLSRSSSTGKFAHSGPGGSCENSGNAQKGRKYSGSKRSYDFDNENASNEAHDRNVGDGDDERALAGERVNRHRHSQRQPRSGGSPSKGRRRTPSRERDQAQQQRSGSRERGSSNGGRRVSRSPGRRSESPITTSSGVTAVASSSANANGTNGRPGKMVSVPATVTSLVMDKSNNAEPVSAAAIKRIQVKRNVGVDAAAGSRTAASPRARSPARTNRAANENQNLQQPISLSRSNSRKAEQSPFRRNPLSEIDTNVVVDQVPLPGIKASNAIQTQATHQKLNADAGSNNKVIVQGIENKVFSCKSTLDNNAASLNSKSKEQLQVLADEVKDIQAVKGSIAVNVVTSATESNKLQALHRSRSSRLSRDLDINPETLTNPAPSYTALLLEDIHNFHQKSTPPAFSLPDCVSKACSILEAVADLNSTTASNLSGAFSEDKRRKPTREQFVINNDNPTYLPQGTRSEDKEPILESEVAVCNDLVQPSFHKYVTVRRGTVGGDEMEEQESSGSNSIVGSQQQWLSPSSWEPNSADSTDCWPSMRMNSREDERSPLGMQRHAVSELGREADESRRRLAVKRRDSEHQQAGIGRGRVGVKGLNTMAAATAST